MFKAIFHAFSVLFYGPHCIACKTFLLQHDFLCTECVCKIKPIVSFMLSVTAKKQVTVFSVTAYKDPLKRMILAKGQRNKIAARYLGELMWHKSGIHYADFDYIVPIPLHWTRFAWRGYNQAETMAHVIGGYSKKPVISLLFRKKRTSQQSFFSAQQRDLNVAGVFCINSRGLKRIKVDSPSLAGKKILLVDDLMTTGSTLKSAASELFKAGASSVVAVVACRVP